MSKSQSGTNKQESWKPFPRQEFALLRDEFEVLFGG